MQKRCPWCGKKIQISRWNKFRRKTPSRFIFERCKFCGQYYGQRSRSPRVVGLCCAMLFSCFLPLLWWPLRYLVLPVIFLLAVLVIKIPLERMTQDENFQKISPVVFQAKILWNNFAIKKKHIYVQIKDFDDGDAFSLASPIFVTDVDKTAGVIYFYFLYDHEKNIRMPKIALYDGEIQVAEIEIHDK